MNTARSNMVLIGSRNLGIHNNTSDWDYAILDLEEGGTFHHIVNEKLEPGKHCYHYNKEYRYKVARFESFDEFDWQFVFNAEDYIAGLIDVNPFDYRDKWVEQLKQIDFYHRYWFNFNKRLPMKRVYHIVFNVEALKEGTLNVSETALNRVKKFHDKDIAIEDYEALISEINALQ